MRAGAAQGIGLLLLAGWPIGALAEQALVAVAANFSAVARQLETAFEQESPHRIDISVASTGQLFAQIVNGAPFDLLLAADQERPARLEELGLAVPGTRRTYAIGRLALWSADPAVLTEEGAQLLRASQFRSLAIANPRVAPYGVAAVETLRSLGIYTALQDRLVTGENVAQAFALVASGNAELGLVALSSLPDTDRRDAGRRWLVPRDLHAPIRQDAVLLTRARGDAAAKQFLEFLAGARAGRMLRRSGYDLPAPVD